MADANVDGGVNQKIMNGSVYDRIGLACGSVLSLIGILGLAGWMSGRLILASLRSDYIPVAPNTSLVFLLFGFALVISVADPGSRTGRWITAGVACAGIIIAGLTLAGYAGGIDLKIDDLLLQATGTIEGIPVGRMSPVSATSILIGSAGLILLPSRRRDLAAVPGTIIALIAGVILIGYWYGAPLLYGGIAIPVSLLSGTGLMVLGIGLNAAGGPEGIVLSVVAGPSTRARILRGVLPVVLALVLVINWINGIIIGHDATSEEILFSAVTALISLLLVYLAVFFVSREIGDSIDQARKDRERAEEEVRRANAYNRSLIESSLDPLVTISRDGMISDVNEAAVRMTGIVRDRLIGTDFTQYFTDPGRAKAGYELAFRDGMVTDYALQIQHPDGTVTPVLYNANVYRDDVGEVLGVFAAARDISAMKKAQKETLAERKKLYDVLETLPVYVCLITPDYHMPFANRYFRETFGEPGGRRCFDFLFHRTGPCENCETFTVARTRAPHHWFWNGPNGRNYSVFDFPFTDSDGSFLILEMGIDITEQKQAEEALRQAYTYNRSLIEASLDPLVTISRDGMISDVNEATVRVTGIGRDRLIGTDFTQYFTDPGRAKAGYELAFREGFVTDYALEIRSRDGGITPVLYNATVFRDATGEVLGVFAAARDITERKKAEDEMKRSFERFRTVMDGLNTLVYVADMETYDLLFVNKYGRELWGDIEGRTCWKTIQSGQAGPCPFCTNSRLVDGNGNPAGVYDWEFRNTVTGKWYDCRDSAIRWLDGRLVRLEIATDITERKHAEELMALTNRKLALMNDVTYQDINNKVSAVLGYVDLCRKATKETDRLPLIERSGNILENIQHLIAKTKTYQQMGKDQTRWMPLDTLVRSQFSAISGKGTITLLSNLDTLEILADPLIERVFYNLFDNSVRHGRSVSRIFVRYEESPGGIVLACEDDGIGIPADRKDTLFDRIAGGQGRFGLFFVREFLNLSGMSIRETGVPGRGARFEIVVPDGLWRGAGEDIGSDSERDPEKIVGILSRQEPAGIPFTPDRST